MRTRAEPKPESPHLARQMCPGFLLRVLRVSVVSIRAKQSQSATGTQQWARGGKVAPPAAGASVRNEANLRRLVVCSKGRRGERLTASLGPPTRNLALGTPLQTQGRARQTNPIRGSGGGPGGRLCKTNPIWRRALSCKTKPISGGQDSHHSTVLSFHHSNPMPIVQNEPNSRVRQGLGACGAKQSQSAVGGSAMGAGRPGRSPCGSDGIGTYRSACTWVSACL